MVMEEHRKVPVDLVRPSFIKVNSASCYPVTASNNIIFYAGENNNDHNTLKIKLIHTKYGKEVEMVLIGSYHKETLAYPRTSNWSSWFRMDIPISELDNLIEQLTKIREEHSAVVIPEIVSDKTSV